MRILLISLLALIIAGCSTHMEYGMARLRSQNVQHQGLAISKDGLTADQIKAISATRPPTSFPVDVAVIFIRKGYIDPRMEEVFKYKLILSLQKSPNIHRVTLIPDFLVPATIGFNTIQELGVRSLSEYVLVFNLDSSNFFRWTSIISGKNEINSTISFILVDSGTAAMLTADRLHSVEEYDNELFKVGEKEEAQKIIFSEQALLLGQKINNLFKTN